MQTAQTKKKGPVPPQLTPFKKGNPGRPPGIRHKTDVRIKEAVEMALVMSGEDGQGKNGAAGYFKWLSRAEPGVFGRIVEKILPHQVTAKIDDRRSMTLGEAVNELKERELPVPSSLLDFNPDDYKVVTSKAEDLVAKDIERFEAEGDDANDEQEARNEASTNSEGTSDGD